MSADLFSTTAVTLPGSEGAGAKRKRAAPGTSARAIFNKKLREKQAAQDAIEYAPEKSRAKLIDLIVSSVRESNGFALFLIDHMGTLGLDIADLRAALAVKPKYEVIRPVREDELNGDCLRRAFLTIRSICGDRVILAQAITEIVNRRAWEDYEYVSGRRHGSPTLKHCLEARGNAGVGLKLDLASLREILSVFDEGRSALAKFEAELARGGDEALRVAGENAVGGEAAR